MRQSDRENRPVLSSSKDEGRTTLNQLVIGSTLNQWFPSFPRKRESRGQALCRCPLTRRKCHPACSSQAGFRRGDERNSMSPCPKAESDQAEAPHPSLSPISGRGLLWVGEAQPSLTQSGVRGRQRFDSGGYWTRPAKIGFPRHLAGAGAG